MKNTIAMPVLAAGCVLVTLASSYAADLELIYSKIPGHPTAVAPGAVDSEAKPMVVEFRALNSLVGSPDGSRWLMAARIQYEPTPILLLGSGVEGAAFAQSGQPVHGGLPNERYDFFGSGLGRFNDNNDFAFSARAMGGVAAHGQKVIRVIDGVATIVTQQGQPYVGLLDVPGNASGDEIVGNSIGSIHLLNDGTVGALDPTIGNIHTSRRPALFYDNIAFQQANVTSVLGMDGQTQFFWDAMTTNTFFTTPNATPISLRSGGSDRERWLCIGRRSGQSLSDRALVVDGKVVIETGVALPGAPNIVNSIVGANVASNGDWYARGLSDNSSRSWTVRNGEVFAVSSDVIPGTDERWSANAFIHFSGNSKGDWILIGRTDNPDVTRDDVIVVNGKIVVREGDQVEENVFIGRANANASAFRGEAFLSDDGYLYFLANIMDAEGNEYLGNPSFGSPDAFLRVKVDLGSACAGDVNGDHVVDISDMMAVLGAWGGCGGDCPADINDDGVVDIADMMGVLSAWGVCE